jgi:hypothetical protein
MPVKIVKTGTTSSKKGVITAADLKNIIRDYDQNVSITTKPPRETVKKSLSVWFESREVLQLLGLTNEQIDKLKLKTAGVTIHFTVHPDQRNCFENNIDGPLDALAYANRLSVAILPTNAKGVDNTNGYVLLPGFHSFKSGITAQDPTSTCCGNMKP